MNDFVHASFYYERLRSNFFFYYERLRSQLLTSFTQVFTMIKVIQVFFYYE